MLMGFVAHKCSVTHLLYCGYCFQLQWGIAWLSALTEKKGEKALTHNAKFRSSVAILVITRVQISHISVKPGFLHYVGFYINYFLSKSGIYNVRSSVLFFKKYLISFESIFALPSKIIFKKGWHTRFYTILGVWVLRRPLSPEFKPTWCYGALTTSFSHP